MGMMWQAQRFQSICGLRLLPAQDRREENTVPASNCDQLQYRYPLLNCVPVRHSKHHMPRMRATQRSGCFVTGWRVVPTQQHNIKLLLLLTSEFSQPGRTQAPLPNSIWLLWVDPTFKSHYQIRKPGVHMHSTGFKREGCQGYISIWDLTPLAQVVLHR